MDKQPFFSIIIPTKNRPEYLNESIQSVLLQNFTDYELIVSDNWNNEKTKSVISKFSFNLKFSSIRPEREMNMIDHWEFASKHAKGKYVILLPDRKVLRQGALKKIYKVASKNPSIRAFSFGVMIYNDIDNKIGWKTPSYKTKKILSSDLIDNFLNENYFTSKSMDLLFPKTLNGCFKNSLAKEAREQNGGYFNIKGVTTPDYSSLFINLALCKEIIHIGDKLIIQQGEHTSNGRHFGQGSYEKYMKSLEISNVYENVAIKAPFIYNLLTVDFQTIKHKFGANLKNKTINPVNYYKTNYWELLIKERHHGGIEKFQHFRKSIEEHNETFINLKIKFSSVEEEFDLVKNKSKLDKVVNFKAHFIDFISNRYPEKTSVLKTIKINYKSALDLAGFNMKDVI